jgi:hypothetical protein
MGGGGEGVDGKRREREQKVQQSLNSDSIFLLTERSVSTVFPALPQV